MRRWLFRPWLWMFRDFLEFPDEISSWSVLDLVPLKLQSRRSLLTRKDSSWEVHRSECREFARRSERRLFTRSDRRNVKDFVTRVGVHAKGSASLWARWIGSLVWTMTHGAPRRVNHVSSATRKRHATESSRQAQYLVVLARINHENHFSWQTQYFVYWRMTPTCFGAAVACCDLFESSEKRCNQIRNWEVGSGCRKRFYRHMSFWFIHRSPFETSGTASCGTTFVHIHSIIGKIGQLV